MLYFSFREGIFTSRSKSQGRDSAPCPLPMTEASYPFSVILERTNHGVMTMTNQSQKTILCITSYEKGQEFMRECKRRGSYVILLTVTTLEDANWPRESIDQLSYIPNLPN